MEKLIIKCRNKIKNDYNIATLLIIDNGTFLYIYLNLNYLFLIKPKNILFFKLNQKLITEIWPQFYESQLILF